MRETEGKVCNQYIVNQVVPKDHEDDGKLVDVEIMYQNQNQNQKYFNNPRGKLFNGHCFRTILAWSSWEA